MVAGASDFCSQPLAIAVFCKLLILHLSPFVLSILQRSLSQHASIHSTVLLHRTPPIFPVVTVLVLWLVFSPQKLYHCASFLPFHLLFLHFGRLVKRQSGCSLHENQMLYRCVYHLIIFYGLFKISGVRLDQLESWPYQTDNCGLFPLLYNKVITIKSPWGKEEDY